MSRTMSRTSIKRRRRQIQRSIRIAFAASILLCCLAIFLTSGNMHVHANQNSYKYYTDITVHSDDTLWSIAMEHRTSEYKSLQAYINEVCEINNIGTEIYPGQILVIPYYSSELK